MKYRAGNFGTYWALEKYSKYHNEWHVVTFEKDIKHRKKWLISLVAKFLNWKDK